MAEAIKAKGRQSPSRETERVKSDAPGRTQPYRSLNEQFSSPPHLEWVVELIAQLFKALRRNVLPPHSQNPSQTYFVWPFKPVGNDFENKVNRLSNPFLSRIKFFGSGWEISRPIAFSPSGCMQGACTLALVRIREEDSCYWKGGWMLLKLLSLYAAIIYLKVFGTRGLAH